MSSLTSGVVHASVVERRRERLPLGTGAYLLVAAFALVLIGVSLFLDRSFPFTPMVPVGLYLSGLVVLAGTGGLYAWRSTRRPQSGPDRPRAIPPSPAPPPRPIEEGRPSRRLHLALLHGGGEWRVPTEYSRRSTSAGWLSWLGHEHRRLGPEAAGFAFSGGYSAGRRGGLVPIPVRRTNWVPPNEGAVRPIVATTTGGLGHSMWEVNDGPVPPTPAPDRLPGSGSTDAHEFTDEELDRLFPPMPERRSRFLSEAPMRIGFAEGLPEEFTFGGAYPPRSAEPSGPEITDPPASTPDEGERAGIGRPSFPSLSPEFPRANPIRDLGAGESSGWEPTYPHPSDDLALEAVNPVPPHLRLGFPATRLDTRGPGERPPALAGGAKSVCASCSKVVVNLRLSGPCPECLRPICTDCLREGLRRFGRGWCEDCAQDVRLGAG